jgi:hypothetical protein
MKARFWATLIAAAVVAGCGLQVQSEDLFLATRTGEGKKLTMLVNYDGTISCNGGKAKMLSDPMLLDARDFTNNLDTDASNKLRFPQSRGSVFTYTVKVQNGTISFPDTAAAKHSEIAQFELFFVQAAANPCGISS